MPARDINFGDVTVHFHGQYMSEHSDAEYETLLKEFLLLGERYDELKEFYLHDREITHHLERLNSED